jgi:hypothetical protein
MPVIACCQSSAKVLYKPTSSIGKKRNERMKWHLPTSLLLHAVLLVALTFLQPASALKPRAETPIHVEIITQNLPKLAVADAQAAGTVHQPSGHLTSEKIIAAMKTKPTHTIVPRPAIQPKPVPDALTVARSLYSTTLLADRHNRSARAAMKTLSVDERIIQLCDIEAMEQVKRANARLKPDYVIAYAMADLKMAPHEVDANGGAFLSHGNWYALAFRCAVSANDANVVAFAYRIGAAVPKSLWAAHNLTNDASSAD